MEADEIMDDDLFADLYGDEEPKKDTTTKSSAAANGIATATITTKTSAPSAFSASTVKGTEAASDPRSASGAPTMAAPHTTQQPHASANDGKAQEIVDGDGYQGWDSQQSKGDGNNGGNNDYQGYGGYEQEGDGYGDYSGGGNGNMVDVGGSTAIKEDGKMFIGGLNWETTDESLKNYFSQFGEVTECTVMRDGTTGRSRGFGFLTFKDPKTVNIVMVKEHYLDGKIIDPKRAIPRDEQEKTSKIFVGGVSQEATEQDFREYFMQFGRVLDATLMMDKDTGRPRGFGFVTFDSEGAVENALNHPNLEIMGKSIEVKKAQPRGNPRDRNAAGGHFDERDDARGSFNRNDRRGFDREGGGAGGAAGAGYGQQGPNGGAVTGQPGPAIYNGMSPAMLAQYWQNMSRYMAVIMQQQQAGRGRGMPSAPTPAINPMMMNPAMMSPQMMQQMQMAQQGQGHMPGNAAAMGSMGMSGMGGMGAQGMGMGGPQGPQQQLQQGPQGPYGGPQGGPQGGYGQGGYGQQLEGGYDHSQQQPHGVHPHGSMGHNGPVDPRYQRQAKEYQSHHQRDFNPQQQGPSSWEGMYDDVPPQQHAQQGAPQHHQQNMNNAHNHNQNHNQHQNQHHQHPNQQQNRMPPAGPSNYNSPGGSTPQPTSGPPPNAPTGPRNARNPVGPANFRGAGARGGAGPGMQGAGGVGPMRGPGGFSRGAAVGGIQQGPGGVGGHGYHPYARNSGNQGGGGGDRGGY